MEHGTQVRADFLDAEEALCLTQGKKLAMYAQAEFSEGKKALCMAHKCMG